MLDPNQSGVALVLPQAVIFDVDGLLVESEEYWDDARHSFVAEHGGQWQTSDQQQVMGANSREWAQYLREHFGIALPPEQIIADVRERVLNHYRRHVPVLPGALETVQALAGRYPLGIASSAPRLVIEAVLGYLDIRALFATVVSSDEVARGKPAPDVYLEAARQLAVAPETVVVFEDSINGVRAAKAAGMAVIAVPNRSYADPAAFGIANQVLPSLSAFQPTMLPALFL